jgi:hypothetical protein
MVMKCVGLLMMVVFLGTGCWEAGTQYSNADVKRKFCSVEQGDSLHNVYEKLGPPLFVTINRDVSGYGANRLERVGADETNRWATLMGDTNTEICLHYSQPKKGGDWFKLYVVRLREGKVVTKEGPAYMD